MKASVNINIIPGLRNRACTMSMQRKSNTSDTRLYARRRRHNPKNETKQDVSTRQFEINAQKNNSPSPTRLHSQPELPRRHESWSILFWEGRAALLSVHHQVSSAGPRASLSPPAE